MDRKTFLPVCVGLVLLWIVIVLGFLPFYLPSFIRMTFIAVPFMALVIFGFYSLIYLTYKVINLKDCPQAQVELQREIERIRRDSRYQSLFRTTSTR